MAKSTLTRINTEQLEEIKKRAEAGNRPVIRELTAIIAAGLKAEEE